MEENNSVLQSEQIASAIPFTETEKLSSTEFGKSLDQSDQHLWNAFKHGSEKAFVILYQRYFKSLFHYGCQFTPNRELIKDCIQDLFIDLREKGQHQLEIRSLKVYLYRAARNNILRSVKKRKNLLQVGGIEGGFEFGFSFSLEDTMIEKQYAQERKDRLQKAINRLSPRQKEVVYHVYKEGMSYEEVKDIMHLQHIKSAQNLLYKTIALLKLYVTEFSISWISILLIIDGI